MSIKKIVLFTCLAGLVSTISAQVTMQLNLPAVGTVQKSQLWNVLVLNNTNKKYDCRLVLILRDRSSGQEVMTATTGLVTIAQGAKQLNINLLDPIQYNYLVPGIDPRIQGLLPAGSYIACYALSSPLSKDNLAEECIPFDVEPLSPPMLIFPADSSLLDVAPTQLSWTPPAPAAMFDRLRYEIVITPVAEGQKPAEAIQENVPLYTDGSLLANMMNYPTAATGFEKEKWYAWQVIAKDEGNYAGKTEVWVFKITTASKKTATPADIYLLMKDNIISTYEINSRKLHIKYFSQETLYTGEITFKDEKGTIIKTIPQTIKPGDNYLEFALNNRFHAGVIYSVTLTDINKKNHVLTFTFNKN